MKKILLLFICLFMSFSNTFAANTGYYISSAEAAKIQKEVSKVGIRLLNSNGLKNRTVFFFDANSSRKAYSIHRDRQIIIYRGLYVLLDDEDQLAAVLAHEISHSMDSYDGIFRGFFHNLNNLCTPRKYEYKSDKRAVDYMVNAGYNPVALIVVMSKVFPQTRYEWCCTHPLTSRRMMEVYEYIYKKYPEYLVNNPYKENPFYQNFLLTSKENREKFQQKVKSNSTRKIHYL